ncbi:MAG: TolC family protein [Rhizobacter sp.]|nr:TolC family protein [Ferruginibacter sp.]
MPNIVFTICLCCLGSITNAQDKITFKTLNEVFKYADNYSVTFKNASQQVVLAKYQTLAAKLSQWSAKSNASFTGTANTKLAANFLPGEVFGGAAGTFQKVTFGQKYESTFNIAPQFDVLNPYAKAQIKTAKANELLTGINNLITRKDLYESIAAAYYNILSYQWQIAVTKNSLTNADTITLIMRNKQKEGVGRSQDLNDAITSQLTIEDKLQQLEVELEQQYNSLKLLCDIAEPVKVVVEEEVSAQNIQAPVPATGKLLQRQSELQKRYYEADLRAYKKWYYPTVGVFSNFSWQQYSNNRFFDKNTFLANSYIGLKLTVPLLPDVNKIAGIRNNRVNIIIQENKLQHARLEDETNNSGLQLDFTKALRSYRITTQIESLKEDTYRKNLSIYQEGILSANDLLTSFNDWLNSRLNTVANLSNTGYTSVKITINNSIQ